MKQKFWMIAVVGVVVPVAVLAAESWFNQGPTPKQMYRDVNSRSAVNQQADDQAPQVRPAIAKDDASSIALTSSDVNAVRLNDLSNKVDGLVSQIATLNQTVSNLNQEVSQLQSSAPVATITNDSAPNPWAALLDQLQQSGAVAYAGVGGAGMLLLGFGFMVGRARKNKKNQSLLPESLKSAVVKTSETQDEEKESQAEYDFMATDEAIPAMLDLARSYLAMDNTVDAKAVLEKVLDRGDEAQCEEAQKLIDEIAEKKND